MGNKKVPNNDRKWNERFRQKIKEDYEKREDEKEKQLAEAEVQRVLQLKIDGVVPATEGNEREHGQREDGRGKTKSKKTRAERKWEKRIERNNQDMHKPPSHDFETQMEVILREDSEASHGDQTQRSADEVDSGQEQEEQGQETEGQMTQRSGYQSHGGQQREQYHSQEDYEFLARQKKSERTFTNPELDNLYEEETLESLYREAEKLVVVNAQTQQKNK